jgi:hypothetical protein
MAITVFKNALRGLFGVHASSTEDPGDAAERVLQHTIIWEIPADGGATSNITDEYFWYTDKACDVKVVKFLPDANTDLSNATNYAILNLKAADGAGGTAAVCANASTSNASANMVLGIPWALTVQTAAVAAGGVLAFGATKAGAGGVDLPTGKLFVKVEYTA